MPDPVTRPQREYPPEKHWDVERQKLRAIWEGTVPDPGIISTYFQHRGLSGTIPPALRYHSRLPYFHHEPIVTYPSIIARIIRGGITVGIHQTWLNPDGKGKALVPNPKKIRKCINCISGGSIQLFPAEQSKPLVLCEGVETALALHENTGWPVWACGNTSLLEKVRVPDSTRDIFIGADLDRSGAGQHAAERLAKRLHAEGRKVFISLPPGPIPDGAKGMDWLDVLTREAAHV